MASNKVVCWNSAGIRASANSTKKKFAFLDKEFPNANYAIAALIETHHKSEDDFPDEFDEYKVTHHLLHTPTYEETHGGIIVFISKLYDITDQKVIIPGRLLNIKITHKDTKREHNISLFYGPRWSNMRKEEILKIIQYFDTHNIDNNNMILGDLNFIDNDLDKGMKMDNRDRIIYPAWEQFKSKNAIVDPFRTQYPKKKMYSYIAPAGKSRGDRVYISEDNLKDITNLKYTNTPFNSAHKIMSFDLNEHQDIGPGYWKMNSSILKDEPYKKEIEEAIKGLNELQIHNPIDWWDIFIIVVRGITATYTKQKAKIKNELKNVILKQIRKLENIQYVDMTKVQRELYTYYKERYTVIIDKEIQGHQIRTRGHPTYEINEPDIDFYAKLEKRYQNKNVITELQDQNGKIQTDSEELIKIAQDYYTKLYTPTRTDAIKQQQLLKNIDKKIDATDRQKLDAPITAEELHTAVYQLHDKKSPGIDGITAEFYKTYWHLIKDNYLNYINAAKQSSFGEYRNTSVTTIIYKHKGEIYILSNYRPISLINVDLKILTKTLTNRLKPILPTIIHRSQTAVHGRKIDHTVHMLRDLIDLVDKEDSQAAFIFLDQEKAFDRVDHQFLFKTMEAFGIGEEFIAWIKVLYSNATTKIKINGYLSASIPLKRGVRQGCPLSALLYVLVIEVLGLQFRKNPNIVGFKVQGEKIISLHYADDAIISITQNQCFKEVIKDLNNYESASGAKINLGKTKGLWVGKWKDRQDKPLDIEWTNQNVKTLGVYFGNQNPAKQTFEEIIPKIKKSMDYWKQFKLSTFAKARVTEIFHASRLWYAATFYTVPPSMQKDLQKSFFDYINYPQTTPTISQQEMQKLRLDGGAKLIDIKTKIDTYKIRWLMELTIDPKLHTHLSIITRLIGQQKGGLQGTDLFFVTKHYANKILKTQAQYYKIAIQAITKLQVKKKIEDIRQEKVFYNPTFKNATQTTIAINFTCEMNKIYTYGQILTQYEKQQNQEPSNRHIANIYPKIIHKDIEKRTENVIFDTTTQLYHPFQETTHKFIYQELIRLTYKKHHSKEKWEERFPNTEIQWNKVWASLNNPLSTEDTKTKIWEQIHLNDYTTYSYNKWHKAQQECPFCNQIPENKYHITIECPILVNLWAELQQHLLKIHLIPITNEEIVFGIPGETPNIILRNWMTFLFRQCISEQENKAYHNKKGHNNTRDIKIAYNEKLKKEIWHKYIIYTNLGRTKSFKRAFAINDYLITWENEQWQILTLFKVH